MQKRRKKGKSQNNHPMLYKIICRDVLRNKTKKKYFKVLLLFSHPVVGIVTRYGLDGPGVESQWE
jgi:hypothetical protein